MERFRFSLDKVLKLRAHREKGARRELAAALVEVRRLEGETLAARADLDRCRHEAAGRGSAAALAGALTAGLQHRIKRLERQWATAESAASTVRENFRKRRMELRSLERLREKRHDEWRLRAQRAEQEELDEMARCRAVASPVEVRT